MRLEKHFATRRRRGRVATLRLSGRVATLRLGGRVATLRLGGRVATLRLSGPAATLRAADGDLGAGRLVGRPLLACAHVDAVPGIAHLRPFVHVIPQP